MIGKKEIECKKCGKKFFDYLSNKRKFCSHKCHNIDHLKKICSLGGKALKGVKLKDNVCYSAYHYRVYSARGNATECIECGTTKAKKFEWANISGRYDDVMDYKQLCISCHRKFDGNFNFFKLKEKKCLECFNQFNPVSSNQVRCGNRYIKGSCSHKHFNEYHKLRMRELKVCT